MHHEAYEGFRGMLYLSLVPVEELRYGLDVGGRNVNGSVREQLPNVEWKGMDIVAGPGVDIVLDASSDDWTIMPAFDIIIATELFEHTPNWRKIIKNMARWLDPEGSQLLVATCASTNRQRHGASGEPLPPPGEWYQNVTAEELRSELDKYFLKWDVAFNPMPGDCYMYARGLK